MVSSSNPLASPAIQFKLEVPAESRGALSDVAFEQRETDEVSLRNLPFLRVPDLRPDSVAKTGVLPSCLRCSFRIKGARPPEAFGANLPFRPKVDFYFRA